MVSAISRCFSERMAGVFRGDLLLRLRRHFESSEERATPVRRSEREEKYHRIGVASDDIRLDAAWYDVWRDGDDLVERFRPYTWVSFPPVLRHLRQGDHLVPWHQDIGYQRLLGERAHSRLITCFVPLEAEPGQCASLEFAVGHFDELPHRAFGDHGAALDDDLFKATKRLDLKLGDAMVFGDFAPHRTYVPDGAVVERRSIEFRLVRPEDSIDGKDYFDIEKGAFVVAGSRGAVG